MKGNAAIFHEEYSILSFFYHRWNSSLIWPFGAVIRHGKGDLYKAEGDVNCAEPGNSSQSRFYR